MSKPVFEDCFAFRGRRNRKSYFLFSLAMTVVSAVLLIPLTVTGAAQIETLTGILVLVALVAAVPLLWASLAVGTQRCRDFGWTGWAVLLTAVPLVGWVFALVMVFVPGTAGHNRYGPDPIGDSHWHGPSVGGTYGAAA